MGMTDRYNPAKIGKVLKNMIMAFGRWRSQRYIS